MPHPDKHQPINTVRLNEKGRKTLIVIYDLYESGVPIEEIAERLNMHVNHVQFLTALDALTKEKLRRD